MDIAQLVDYFWNETKLRIVLRLEKNPTSTIQGALP